MTDIHSCSYYCDRPGCIKAQRDELRDSNGAGNQVPPCTQPAPAQPADKFAHMRHPDVQRVIGQRARTNIELQLVEQLLEDPHFETTSMDMEYWSSLHDKLKAALTRPESRLPLVQATAPREIWLQISDEEGDSAEPFPDDHDDITWCQDSVTACQVPYVRADLAQPAQEAEELQALCDRLSDLLTRTANSLKGPPPERTLHDWSDLPEVAAAQRLSDEPVAYRTEHDDGPMLWHDLAEARLYCDDGVEPTPLYARGAP